jgi:hypothetical protein
MRTTYRAASMLLLAALALAGCAQAGTGAPTPSGTSGLGTVGGTGRAGTLNAQGYPASAEDYTKAAVAAWASGDTARVDDLRAPSATIFATLSAGNYEKHFVLKNCQGAAGSSFCTFFNNVGDQLVLRVGNEKLGGPHAVTDGTFDPITFPTDMQAYAQEALDAWRADNSNRISYLTTADAKTHLDAIAVSHRADTWTFQDSQGAAGSSYLTWRSTAGDRIVFRFHNPGVVPDEGPQHRIVDVLWNP